MQPHSQHSPAGSKTGFAIRSHNLCLLYQWAWLFPVDLSAPGAEEGVRSLEQLVHPPLGPAQGVYFKGGMFFFFPKKNP